MEEVLSHVVVVGGTGILAPAVRTLVERGAGVSVVTRSGLNVPAGAATLVADVTDPGRLAEVLDGVRTPVTAALAYQPFAPQEAWAVLAERVAGPVVALLTSAHAAPDAVDPVLPGVPLRLMLGWHGTGRDARWHTPEEVSAAAVAVLDGVGPAVLGNLRPWSDRP